MLIRFKSQRRTKKEKMFSALKVTPIPKMLAQKQPNEYKKKIWQSSDTNM